MARYAPIRLNAIAHASVLFQIKTVVLVGTKVANFATVARQTAPAALTVPIALEVNAFLLDAIKAHANLAVAQEIYASMSVIQAVVWRKEDALQAVPMTNANPRVLTTFIILKGPVVPMHV